MAAAWPSARAAVVAALCAAAVGQSHAVNKCTTSNGAVVYQDTPCASSAAAATVHVAPNVVDAEAGNRPDHIRAGIAQHRPVVGMTLAELHRAIGLPAKVNTGDYGRSTHDQLIYYTASRTVYVYVTDGVVSAVQDTEGGLRRPAPVVRQRQPERQCPSANDIRNIEVELSKLENRGRPQVLAELQRQLGDARACRR